MLLKDFVNSKITIRKERLLYRSLITTDKSNSIEIIDRGEKKISFCCNDYLGLSNNIEVKKDAISAIKKYGVGSGSSRLITGNHQLYEVLEKETASFKGTKSCIVFGSGYLANIGVISAFMNRHDLIIADKDIHTSIIDGVILSGAKLLRFKHNDIDDCLNALKKNRAKYNNCLILTESVFSMDGSIAPVGDLYEIALKYQSWLLTDDAHSTGIFNNQEFTQNQGSEHIQIGTFSKAIGSYGGYACGSHEITEYIANYAKPLIYSTALPASVIASSIASIRFIKNNKDYVLKSIQNAEYFTFLLGIEKAKTPIVIVILKDEEKTINASKKLRQEGFIVVAIRPPTVSKGTSRLRFTFSSLHKKEDIEKLANLIKKNGWV